MKQVVGFDQAWGRLRPKWARFRPNLPGFRRNPARAQPNPARIRPNPGIPPKLARFRHLSWFQPNLHRVGQTWNKIGRDQAKIGRTRANSDLVRQNSAESGLKLAEHVQILPESSPEWHDKGPTFGQRCKSRAEAGLTLADRIDALASPGCCVPRDPNGSRPHVGGQPEQVLPPEPR